MKKLYTLAALAFAAMGANADVVLTMGGEVCDPSKTVEIYAQVENMGTEEDPFIIVEWGSTDPKIKNIGTTDANVTITATTKEPVGVFSWCGPMTMTMQCTALEVPTESRSGVLGAGVEDALVLDIIIPFGEYGPDYYGEHSLTLTIKEGSKSTDYHLNYIYNASCDAEAGLAGVTAITADSKSNVIYDLTGRVVNKPVAGQLYIQGGKKVVK